MVFPFKFFSLSSRHRNLAMFSKSTVSSSIDMVEATIGQLDLLHEVDKLGNLYRGSHLSNAIRRYEELWLPLASTEDLIAAPLDIEWVWYLHMLSPRVYESDCKRLVSKTVDHKIVVGEHKKKALEKSANLWKERYPSEPFEVNLDSVSPSFVSHTSVLSCDLVIAALCQRMFSYQVSLPYYYDRKFLGNAAKRYKKFLRLHSKAPNEILIPCQDIDLMWHTHLVHPLTYKKDCSKALNGTLDHDQEDHSASGESASICAMAITREHWNVTYGDNYALAGTILRREPPPLLPRRCADPHKDLATPIYTLKLIKAEVQDFPPDSSYVVSLSQNGAVDIEQTVTTVTGSASCANEDDGLVSFCSAAVHADAPMMLNAKVTLAETSKSNTAPLLFFPESLDAVLKENDVTRPKVSKRVFKIIPPGVDDAGRVALTFQILPPLRTGNYGLHVNRYDSDIQVPDMGSGVSRPCSIAPSFMNEGPCNVMLFGINSYSGIEVFKCRVVEAIGLPLLAVEISELSGRVLASSHTVQKGELPFKGQVTKRLSGFPYAAEQDQPTLLVRGQRDWGLCYTRTTVSSRIKLNLFHLESKKRIEILQPSKTSYKFKVGESKECVNVETISGDITIPRDITAVPEILALCFSLRSLKNTADDFIY